MDWDLSSYFPAFGDATYTKFVEELRQDTANAVSEAANLPDLTEATVATWVIFLTSFEDLRTRFSHLGSYLGCLTAADNDNEAYAAAYAELSTMQASLQKVSTPAMVGLGQAEEDAFAALVADPAMTEAGYRLAEERKEGRERMSLAEEALAADLGIDGKSAWARLYNQLVGGLTFTLTQPDGTTEEVPMGRRNSFLTQADRGVRAAAFQASSATFRQHLPTFTAALNAIAGTRLTLQQRRGQTDFLTVAADGARTSKATLEALFTALENKRALPQAVFRERCQLMGVEAGAVYDWNAPLPQTTGVALDWEKGCALIESSFDAAYPALGDFFRHMLKARHFDYQPRPGKRPGGFCSTSQLTREPRIFMTFENTLSEVVTLAHEVGHAWHSHVLKPRRNYASTYPMTLAETASTFAEKILVNGILTDPASSPEAKRALLDSETQRIVSYLLDIPMRFCFERAFYTERAQGVVPASRLEALMTEQQQAIFGDTLAPDGADPLFWASKLHFYIDGVFFYNFPYVYGYLLSAALAARFEAEGASFLPAYEAFLGDTGMMSCEAVAQQHLGENLEDPAFWERAIEGVCDGAVESLQTL